MIPTTLIFGNGPCAQSAAQALLARRQRIILATQESELNFDPPAASENGGRWEWLGGVKLQSCQRPADGGLVLQLRRDGDELETLVQRVIIAEENREEPQFDIHGLTPGTRVWALSTVLDLVGLAGGKGKGDDLQLPWAAGERVVLLNGGNQENHPVITRRVMALALALQADHGLQVYVLTDNLKVAAPGLEALVHRARQAGVVIAKSTGDPPVLEQGADGTVQLTVYDEITAETYALAPAGVVVDEQLRPAGYLHDLAAILELKCNPDGFVQADNVHRLPCSSNRPAIRVAGPARGVMATAAQIVDGRIAAVGEAALAHDIHPDIQWAEINAPRCVRCLTCHRLCPYRAITIDDRGKVQVRSEECRKCGICSAECPRGAVTLDGLPANADTDGSENSATPKDEAPRPLIYLFGCSRSALPASAMAGLDRQFPAADVRWVTLPCAGALSREHLWSAYAQGATGVMVLTCHLGNCHSEAGNQLAHQRVDRFQAIMAEMGIDPQRLGLLTLAANMGADFAAKVGDFADSFINASNHYNPQ